MMSYHPRTSLLLAIALLTPLGVWAQFHHPHYLSARTDLRRATLLMQIPDEPNVTRDMRIANEQTERAIHELDIAARFDRRDIDEHPPVDVRIGRGGRFREILRLLEGARRDIGQEEDNPLARVWRNRAFGYIDAAMDVVRKGGYDKFRDETAGMPPPPMTPVGAPPPPMPASAPPPRYLSAISDLRYARALLYRADWREVMRDQRSAVAEIDRAIGDARQAAIDDGRNPNAQPPVDVRMGWEGRFRKAMESLDAAERDLTSAPEYGPAAAWRNSALRNIQNAKAFVGRAMRDSWWR
jgi:hypothetical protein